MTSCPVTLGNIALRIAGRTIATLDDLECEFVLGFEGELRSVIVLTDDRFNRPIVRGYDGDPLSQAIWDAACVHMESRGDQVREDAGWADPYSDAPEWSDREYARAI